MKNEVLIRQTPNRPSSRGNTSTFYTLGLWQGRVYGGNNPTHFKSVGADSRTTVRVIEYDELLPSVHNALQALSEIAQLQDNWDGYGAIAPSSKVIKEAEGFIRRLNILQQDIYFVSPGPNANLLIDLKNGERTVSFHFHPEKALQFVCFEGKNFICQGNYEPPVIFELLDWLHI